MSRIEKPVSVKRHGFWGRLIRGQLFDAGKDAAMLEDDNRYRQHKSGSSWKITCAIWNWP